MCKKLGRLGRALRRERARSGAKVKRPPVMQVKHLTSGEMAMTREVLARVEREGGI